MRLKVLTGIVILSFAGPAFAQYNSAVSQAQLDLHFAASTDSDGVYYTPQYRDIDLFGAKVSGLDSCDGNIGLTITNAFNDGTIKRIYENFSSILKSFDGSSAAIYLSSLYIQKSNAGLYQLITEGIDIGLDDFLSGMASCEAIAASAVSMVPDSVVEAQKATQLNDIIERNSSKFNKNWSDVDITKYVKSGINKTYSSGLNWFGGMRGGENQPAADIVRGAVKYGYCIYRGVSKTQCESTNTLAQVDKNAIANEAGAKLQSEQEMEQILLGDGLDTLQDAAVQIIGNEYLTICEGCETVSIKAGGIKAYMTSTQEVVYKDLVDLASKPVNQITDKELLKVSGAPPLITTEYFRAFALLESNWDRRNQYINGVAYDVAYQRSLAIMDRIEASLVASQDTPEVKNGGVTQNISKFIDKLDKERQRLILDAEAKNYTPLQYSNSTLRLLTNKSSITNR